MALRLPDPRVTTKTKTNRFLLFRLCVVFLGFSRPLNDARPSAHTGRSKGILCVRVSRRSQDLLQPVAKSDWIHSRVTFGSLVLGRRSRLSSPRVALLSSANSRLSCRLCLRFLTSLTTHGSSSRFCALVNSSACCVENPTHKSGSDGDL